MLDLSTMPQASNLALQGPYRMTLEEFHTCPVSVGDYKRRQEIYKLEDMLHALDSPAKIDEHSLKPVHMFGDGYYMRELTMPAGFIIVGKRHAQAHGVVMTKGWCTVLTERGWEDLDGYTSFESPAGEKRVLFVHEETTWVTFHETDETTLDGVERDLILTESAAIRSLTINTPLRIGEEQ